MDHLGKMNPVLRVSTPIYGVSEDMDGKAFIRSFIGHTKKHAVKQSMKQQVSSNFQIYPGKSDDGPPLVSKSHMISNSFTLYTALYAIQLYVLSFGVDLLDRSVIYVFLQQISINLQLLLCI